MLLQWWTNQHHHTPEATMAQPARTKVFLLLLLWMPRVSKQKLQIAVNYTFILIKQRQEQKHLGDTNCSMSLTLIANNYRINCKKKKIHGFVFWTNWQWLRKGTVHEVKTINTGWQLARSPDHNPNDHIWEELQSWEWARSVRAFCLISVTDLPNAQKG